MTGNNVRLGKCGSTVESTFFFFFFSFLLGETVNDSGSE